MKNDVAVEILKDIRTSVRETNSRIDQTNAELGALREELSRRIVESEIRTSTAITELAGSVREVRRCYVQPRAQGSLRFP